MLHGARKAQVDPKEKCTSRLGASEMQRPERDCSFSFRGDGLRSYVRMAVKPQVKRKSWGGMSPGVRAAHLDNETLRRAGPAILLRSPGLRRAAAHEHRRRKASPSQM